MTSIKLSSEKTELIRHLRSGYSAAKLLYPPYNCQYDIFLNCKDINTKDVIELYKAGVIEFGPHYLTDCKRIVLTDLGRTLPI